MYSNSENYCISYQIIKENKLFKDISDEAVTSLLENCELELWKKGKSVLSNNKTLNNFYIILKGRIKIYILNGEIDRSLTLFLLLKNDVFDVFTLISNLQHNVNYKTLDDTNLLVITNSKMKKWLENYPVALYSFFNYSLTRFEILETHLNELTFNDVTTRLVKLFLQNLNIVSGKIESINGLNHDELAQLIGSTRPVINRSIQELKEENIIFVGRKHIEIINLELLIKKSRFASSFS